VLTHQIENEIRRLANARRQVVQHFVAGFLRETLVVRAEVLRVPRFGITAIAATADVAFKLDSMAGVIRFLEAAGANNASWVLLAVHASPGHITIRELLGADSHRPHGFVDELDLASEVSDSALDFLLLLFRNIFRGHQRLRGKAQQLVIVKAVDILRVVEADLGLVDEELGQLKERLALL